jgi:hypothetical protein
MVRTTALRPEGVAGLAMPRYFSKGLSARGGLQRNSESSCSRCGLSSGRTPGAHCTSRGTAIRLMRAFFFGADFAIPQFRMEFLILV